MRPILVCVTALLVFPGCAKQYLVVDATFDQVEDVGLARDVRGTSTYRERLSELKTVTFRLPDSCLNQSAAQATGASRSSGVIVLTQCAVWLAELERAVAREGYRVISWDALHRLEQQKNISTYVAAQQLGADLVFILNSLDTHEILSGAKSQVALAYFHSEPRGEVGEPIALNESQRRVIRSIVEARMDLRPRAGKVTALSATLDASAILAASGESVWFYRWGVTKPLTTREDTRFLLRGRGTYWRPVKPDLPEAPPPPPELASRDVVTQQRDARGQDPLQVARFTLVKRVAEDFVGKFRAGER